MSLPPKGGNILRLTGCCSCYKGGKPGFDASQDAKSKGCGCKGKGYCPLGKGFSVKGQGKNDDPPQEEAALADAVVEGLSQLSVGQTDAAQGGATQ